MRRTFIETPNFTRKWHKLNLTDDDLIELQNTILNNPQTAGDTIPGTGGIKKIRVPAKGHGKRGGARVIYVDIEIKEVIYLLNVYAKNEQSDLTPAERKVLKSAVSLLKEE